jgi:hypothetical protein
MRIRQIRIEHYCPLIALKRFDRSLKRLQDNCALYVRRGESRPTAYFGIAPFQYVFKAQSFR